jgi:hypothetical protein
VVKLINDDFGSFQAIKIGKERKERTEKKVNKQNGHSFSSPLPFALLPLPPPTFSLPHVQLSLKSV